MNECLKCGQAGMRYVTHACMTGGAVLGVVSWLADYPHHGAFDFAISGETLASFVATEKEGFEPSFPETTVSKRDADISEDVAWKMRAGR